MKRESAQRLAFEPKGMATGIGSLPHEDPEAAVLAVLAAVPECPFWPQLPTLGPQEGMTLQYVAGFPGLRHRKGALHVDTGEEGQAELAAFYEKILEGETYAFGLPEDRAAGFYAFERAVGRGLDVKARYLKGHVTGPVTLASSLKDGEGRELTHDAQFREAVGAQLAANAAWQAECFAALGYPSIIFLDEPTMEVYGSAYSSLDEETVTGLWTPVLDAIAAKGGLSGIHCCGNTDWALLLSCGTDIVNFDAYRYMEKMLLYPKEAHRFLKGGGALAWGIVPTDEAALDETPQALLARLEEGIGRFAAAGVDRDLLLSRAVITPSCGMGSLTVALAERILGLLAATGELYRARYFP